MGMKMMRICLHYALPVLAGIALAFFLTGCVNTNANPDARKMYLHNKERLEKLPVTAGDLNVQIPAEHPLFDAVAIGRVKYKEVTPNKNDDDILRSNFSLSLMNVGYFAYQKENARYIADALILEAGNSGTFTTKGKTVVEYTLRDAASGAVVYRKTLTGTASESGSSSTDLMKGNYVRWIALRETVRQFLNDITVVFENTP